MELFHVPFLHPPPPPQLRHRIEGAKPQPNRTAKPFRVVHHVAKRFFVIERIRSIDSSLVVSMMTMMTLLPSVALQRRAPQFSAPGVHELGLARRVGSALVPVYRPRSQAPTTQGSGRGPCIRHGHPSRPADVSVRTARLHTRPVSTTYVLRSPARGVQPEREHRAQLAKYCEHITLAQALVYPLLKYEPTVLAVTSIVCAAYLVSSVFDEHLNAGLAALVGAPLERTWQCRRDVQTHVNLSQLQQLLSR